MPIPHVIHPVKEATLSRLPSLRPALRRRLLHRLFNRLLLFGAQRFPVALQPLAIPQPLDEEILIQPRSRLSRAFPIVPVGLQLAIDVPAPQLFVLPVHLIRPLQKRSGIGY
jgi:hypothetical protein